jgi:hypothetical protein
MVCGPAFQPVKITQTTSDQKIEEFPEKKEKLRAREVSNF